MGPSAPANENPAGADEEIFTPVVGSVLADPLLVQGTDALDHLAYELFLTNTMGQTVTVDALSVLGDGEEMIRLSGDELLPWMRAMGASEPGYVLAAGQSATVILNVTVPEGAAVPQALSHVIEISPEKEMPPMVTSPMQETIAHVAVSDAAPVVIGSPVVGDGWLDGNGCCAASAHRSAINPVNGALYAPERFAIDFVQLDDESRIFDGPIDEFESYAYFGADIVAVGDGPIVSMKWDLPDETPGAHPVGLELTEYGGNHVFHVMDSPLPLASNGLPFVFESFTLSGTVSDLDLEACMAEPRPCNVDGSDDAAMENVMPLQQDVISVREAP